MPNISNVVGDVSFFQSTYKSTLALGESLLGQNFMLTIDGYPDLKWLVQTASVPSMKRDPVETYGPQGVKFMQQGRYDNVVETPLSFKEVLSGAAYSAIRSWIKNKEYQTVTLELISESDQAGADAHKWVIEDAWLEIDAADLSVEDAVPLKPSGTLHGSYFPV